MKCNDCQKRIEGVLGGGCKETYWHKLFFYFEHELHEGEITEVTFNDMTDALCYLRPEETEE